MTMRFRSLFAVVNAASLLLIGGCMMGTQYTSPSAQQLATAGYGAPLTIDYKWLVLCRDNQIVAVTYDGNSWSQEFYTGSISKGFRYGNYNADEATI
jgi:hypothetical protein